MWHVVKINGQLHIYRDGVYVNGYKEIEAEMIQYIPNLKKTQRREVLNYMELVADECQATDARFIAFNNGIYDVIEEELKPFSTEIIVTNKIPWNYVPDAYNELADNMLNKLVCGDTAIRALLEKCIGYSFYRRNELGKADGKESQRTYTAVFRIRLKRQPDQTDGCERKDHGIPL